ILCQGSIEAFSYTPNVSLSLPLGMGNPCLASQYHNLQTSPVISVSSCHQASYGLHENPMASGYYLSHGLRPNGAPPLESPRIEITTYGQMSEEEVEESSTVDPMAKRVNIVTLTLPSIDGYRDPSCLSPASSLSSRSCNSEASYESGFYNYDNSPQNSPWQSPCVSPKGSSSLLSCPHAPGSVPSPHHSPSPVCTVGSHGKRKYSFNGAPYRQPSYSPNQSPGASPQGSPRLSGVEEAWLGSTTNQYTNSAIVAAINALSTDGLAEIGEGVPLKSRKTNLDHNAAMSLKVEPGGDEMASSTELCQEDYSNSSRTPFKKESYCAGFLDVPPHPYSWPKPKPYISPSLPALDWQLPSCSGPYSLQIEVQPKSHHRAHYETEGSRGAVKALSGGHPVVQLYGYMESEPLTLQLFIGTADDRLLRPHAFYQVHRITGKTVSTASHEALQSNTKVLEIPLLPENNMRAIIDCAGILKLRNSDIELRKGETDIGRKNTRVRMVFRVHINQPNGRTLSLQVASNPIECCKYSTLARFTHTKQCLTCIPVIPSHSLHELYEKAFSNIIRKCIPTPSPSVVPILAHSIFSTLSLFYFAVPMIKTEPTDDYEGAPRMPMHSKPFYSQQRLPPMMPLGDSDSCMVGNYSPCPPRPAAMPCSSPGSSPKLHDLSPVPFPKCLSSSPTQSAVPGGVASLQDTPAHPSLALPSSPDHTSLNMPHPQGSPHLSSPSYHPLYPSSSPSSSPTSHPSTPGAATESPYLPPFGSAQPRGSPPSLLAEDSSSPALSVTIKQEPQELDQMYLDDVVLYPLKCDLSCQDYEAPFPLQG
uniref:Nuclear factor of activated T cells 1 n=1 Tax=Astyanax mexicanus TaxID=7994 RepID=A0A8B9R3M4_ASTMX